MRANPHRINLLRLMMATLAAVGAPTLLSAQGSEQVMRVEPKSTTTRVPRDLISSIVQRFGVEQATLNDLLDLLTPLLNSPPVAEQVVLDQLIRHKVKEPFAVEAATALITVSRGSGDPITKKELGDFLLTYAAASLGSDRALTSSTLVEFAKGFWALRVVTAGAVSNADTTGSAVPAGTTQELFRTRTADLLTMMQVGGNAVLRSHWNVGEADDALSGALTLDAGILGDWLNPKTDSRYALGGTLQFRYVLGTAADPVQLILVGRGGYRWAKSGILTDDPAHPRLAFFTGSLEFHLPGGKVPFGLSVNVVDGVFRDYSQPIHVYTSLKR